MLEFDHTGCYSIFARACGIDRNSNSAGVALNNRYILFGYSIFARACGTVRNGNAACCAFSHGYMARGK
jgi:hypothetical protein